MKYLTARSAGRCVLLVVLLAMHSRCASPNRAQKRTSTSDVRALQLREPGDELQDDLSQFLDYAEDQIAMTANQIEVGTQSAEVRKAALLWKVEFFGAASKRPSLDESMAFLMDTWAFCIRQTNYLQSGEGKNLFGDQQPLAIQAAIRVQRAVETVARKHADDDELPDVIRRLESYARANPMQGVFAHEALESFSAGKEGNSLLSRIFGATWGLTKSGRDVLDPTSSLAESVDRFTELMDDYPALVRWQAQLLWIELEKSTSFQTTMNGIESFSRTAESLPRQLREELRLALDDIDARQPELRKTLEKARETVDAVNAVIARAETVSATVERSVEGVTRAGEVWQTTAEAVTDTFKQIEQLRKSRAAGEPAADDAAGAGSGGAGSTNNKKRRFDITDYTQTAEALTRSTGELRDLLSEMRSFLSGETLEKDLSRVVPLTKAALAETITETRGIVDHIAWRAVQLCGLVFLMALIYRFLAGRHVGGRVMSQ